MTLKTAFVKWVDSSYFKHEGELSEEDKKNLEPKTLFSVGFVVHEEDSFVSICQDFEMSSEMTRLVMSIPKSCIEQIEYIDMEIE